MTAGNSSPLPPRPDVTSAGLTWWVAQTPVHASMAMRPCFFSDASKYCSLGNMLGKVSKASPLPKVYRPSGSQ